MGRILGTSATGTARLGSCGRSYNIFASEELLLIIIGASTIAASFLCSKRRRLFTIESINPMTREARSPIAIATARRFAAITPESQNQWRYERAPYFQEFLHANDVKAIVTG